MISHLADAVVVLTPRRLGHRRQFVGTLSHPRDQLVARRRVVARRARLVVQLGRRVVHHRTRCDVAVATAVLADGEAREVEDACERVGLSGTLLREVLVRVEQQAVLDSVFPLLRRAHAALLAIDHEVSAVGHHRRQ